MKWDEICAKVLADCGRCCCLCRRFKPIRLQVHHIVPREEGGEDKLENAIVLCMTCHTDVHTKAPFTRRFTVEELKMHRDNVCRLVHEGKLPAGEESAALFDELPVAIAQTVANSLRQTSRPDLIPSAVRLLVAAASSDGTIIVLRDSGGQRVIAAKNNFVEEPKNERCAAEWLFAVQQLEENRLIKAGGYKREVFGVTYHGYLLADELLAEGGQIIDKET